jgi:ribosomal-protein-alanine N-acetyltransferase
MIRKLNIDDLSQVAAIENATQVVPWTDRIFKDCFHAGYPGWVLEQEDKVIGFTILSIRGDECHLLNLAILPGFQRRGFGLKLLAHAVEIAKKQGAMIIYLEVRESNDRAIALYEKLHFVQIGTRKDYYPAYEGRENGLIYALDLSGVRV